ncbi:MAG: acetate--CoA ligase family protein [Nitrososphaeraceae archaeon]|nr:acetate--CoA ligase family protein [Nitrososphaeraceae archaeon]MDW0331510.1 acetate--CoA ligase family protein [Nitrososphaeraceae archaeon]
MRLLEYQGKELFLQYQIPIPKSYLANSLREAKELSSKFEFPLILKSQVAAGGRGKAGAIVKCRTQGDVVAMFPELMNKEIKGELPRSILLEQGVHIEQELYISIFLNRGKRCYSLISSAQGGIEIEGVENKFIVDLPNSGLTQSLAREAASKLNLQGQTAESFENFAMNLSRLVFEKEAELAEINPAVVLEDGSLMALDAKVIIDDNALFRHPELSKYQHMSESELQARKSGFSFVELDGNIAIIGNGAGLVMSTLDIVSDQGGKAGCFLDFGGSATAETIYDSLKVISKTKKIKAILINLFGGIVKTSMVAQGILRAYHEGIIEVPTFARITGAESESAKALLKNSNAKMYDSAEQAIRGMLDELSKTEEIYGK